MPRRTRSTVKRRWPNALAETAGIESTIDSGQRFGDARFRYADEVGVQLLPRLDDTSATVLSIELGVAVARPLWSPPSSRYWQRRRVRTALRNRQLL
jgi:hypothetical protein